MLDESEGELQVEEANDSDDEVVADEAKDSNEDEAPEDEGDRDDDSEDESEDEDEDELTTADDGVESYLKKHDGSDMSLSEAEKTETASRLRLRLTNAVQQMKNVANETSEAACMMPTVTRIMTRRWRWFFIALNVTKTVDFLMKHTPLQAQYCLGSSTMSLNDLSDLPDDWAQKQLIGIYVDLTTDANGQNFRPYVGSATGQIGLAGRVGHYNRLFTKKSMTIKALPKANKHELHIIEPGVQCKFRLIAVFGRENLSSILHYIYLYEFLASGMLHCFEGAKLGVYATNNACRALQKAFGEIPSTSVGGLNDALQILQPSSRSSVKHKCKNCGTEEGKNWYCSDDGDIFGGRICMNCYNHRRRSGTERPQSLIDTQQQRKAPRPNACLECKKPLDPAGKKIWSIHPITGQWVCNACAARGRRKKEGPKPRPAVAKNPRLKVEKPDVCPICNLPVTHWRVNKTGLGARHPSLMPHVCGPCFNKHLK